MIVLDETTILALAPPSLVVLLALGLIIFDAARPARDSALTVLAAVGVTAIMAVTLVIGPLDALNIGLLLGPAEAFDGAYVRDALTSFLDLLLLGVALLTVLFGADYLRPRGLPTAEFAALLLFAISGAMLIGGARDLVLLFLALELLVLPGYLLAAYAKRDGLATEGAIKYFLLGSFSSAIFLFGLVLVFGFAGTTRIPLVAESLLGTSELIAVPAGLLMGVALLTAGAAFKIAAVPFHYWTPDAYQGSPTPVTGYLSVAPKIAAFALILRLFVEALGDFKADWTPFVVVLAVLTMSLGNLVALTQDNIKRMLAYSSIAHTGYIMVGLAAFGAAAVGSVAEQAGLEALLFYAFAYAGMNLGAFAVVAALQRRPGVTSQISTFAGLGRRSPLLALLMTLFLLSLLGIPPLAGFLAKWYVIQAALQVGGWLNILAVITVINAMVGAFYYLRVAVYIWMRDPAEGVQPVEVGTATRVGLVLAAVVTLFIWLPGVSTTFFDMAREAASALIAGT
ncbi:NADH-quinone oxidoreductase subunit N [soil metagenome]